jgi:hypothetical protein
MHGVIYTYIQGSKSFNCREALIAIYAGRHVCINLCNTNLCMYVFTYLLLGLAFEFRTFSSSPFYCGYF